MPSTPSAPTPPERRPAPPIQEVRRLLARYRSQRRAGGKGRFARARPAAPPPAKR